ncbi:MAG TPA: PD-(D/E)XK nuclease family protein [Polyangiaceae bacterium]|nr:PD-(D/E)XK nuclease family protein [Polyangiaceae bacterium]
MLHLVPHERQAELAETSGQRSLTWRALIADLAGRVSSAAPAAAEATRLCCAKALKRSGRYAAAFDLALGGLRRAGANPALLGRLGLPRARQFAEALSAVDTELERAGLRDERGDAWLAARAARAGELGAVAGADTLVVRGFSRYEAGELELLEALHERIVAGGGRGVVIELPRLELGPAQAALERVAAELEARWADAAEHPALEFRDPSAGLDVELVPAQDDASEARAVARAILEGLSRGVALDRMAIALPELSEAFLEPLRRELEATGIPFFEPRGRPLDSSPHAHAALALLKLAAGPIDRDVLVDVLRTPGLAATRWSGDALEREEWASELASLPLGVDRNGAELLNELTNRAEELERDGGDAERTRAAAEATRRCLDELAKHRGPHSRAVFRANFLELLAAIGLMGPSASTLALALERRAAGRRELLRAVADNGTAVRALAAAFERTSRAAAALGLSNEVIALDEYLIELELSAEAVTTARGARRGAALWIARTDELAGLELELVVLCRASSARLEGGGGSSGTELLGDDLVAALPGRHRPGSRTLATSFSALGLASILCGARRAIVTYARRDGRGPLTPSQLVLALEQRRPAREAEPASPLHPRARPAAPRRATSMDATRRAQVDLQRLSYFLDPDAVAGPFTGSAGDIAALIGGSRDRPLPVTTLETYARCPFLAFASYGLKAVRDEAPGDGIGVRERGSLIHAALAAAHEAMKPLWGRRDAAELERIGLEAATRFFERRGRGALRRAGLSAAFYDVAAAVRWSLAEGADLPFSEAERGFGRGQGWSALSVGQHWLSGRIDRIDFQSGGSRARVIDYKTGKAPTHRQLDEELLQPWLYGVKVAEELGASEVESGYLALADRAPRLGPKVALTQTEGVEAALARAERSLLKLSQGAIEPRPRQAKSCARCDGRDLCRRPLSAPLASEDDE